MTHLRMVCNEGVTLSTGLVLSGGQGGFAVVYEIHVYTDRADSMAGAYAA